MASVVKLVHGHDMLCDYTSPLLATVCTLREACYMWNKSEATIKDAIYRGKVDARKSFTGGDWLITTASLEKRYGNPKENTLWQLQK
jgi:hypothetical protein